MGFLRIYCEKCHNVWEVYPRDKDKSESHICPHCGTFINESTWYGYIIPAWESMDDANDELRKDSAHTGDKSFKINYMDRSRK